MLKKLSLFLVIAILLTAIVPVSMPQVMASSDFTKAGDTKTYDFEDGTTQGWAPMGTVTVAADQAAAITGTYGLKSSAAESNWNGASLDISSFPAGEYHITAKVKLVTGSGELKVTHQYKDGSGTNQYDAVTSAAISYDVTTIFDAKFTKTKVMTQNAIKIESVNGATPDYYLDDVTITANTLDSASSTSNDIIYNFDEGTAQGWVSRGDSAVNVAVSTDYAVSAPYSLKVTGRSSGWHGIALNPSAVFEKDKIYTIKAKVKSVNAAATASSISLTMEQDTTGNKYPTIDTTGVNSETDWQELSGTYSFTDGVIPKVLYFESSDPTNEFYIDDIVITPPAPVNAGISNIGFEDNTTQEFGSRLGAIVAVSDKDKKNGTYSLLTTDRTDIYDGPIIDVTGKLLYGSSYDISAWVKLDSATTTSGSIVLSAEYTDKDNNVTYQNIVTVTASSDNWVNVVQSNFSMTKDAKKLRLYFEGKDSMQPFYLDDFSVTPITGKPIQTDIPSLKDIYKDDFDFGSAVVPSEYEGVSGDLLKKHFNSLVAGNDNKPDAMLPKTFSVVTGSSINWKFADFMKNYTEENNMSWRWHTFAWHSQCPDWLFTDENGNDLTTTDSNGNIVLIETDPVKQAANKEVVLNRLRTYITLVIERYGAYIDSYDVVNEVIEPSQPDGMRRSKWYVVTGEDFIKVAFKTAKTVRDQNGYKGKLYINDYNTEQPAKRDFLYALIQRVNKDEKLIEGVGHQAHIGHSQPSVSLILESIKKFGDAGLENQITELDMSNYDNSNTKYDTIPESILLEQGHRYKQLFEAILELNKTPTNAETKKYVNSVTVWGVSDLNTWLLTFPITRKEQPLLFDKYQQAKYAYWGVVLAKPGNSQYASKLPVLVKNITIPKGTPTIDGNKDLIWGIDGYTVVKGDSGYTGSFKTRWDEKNVYLLTEIKDPSNGNSGTVDVYVDGVKTTFTKGASSTNYKTVAIEGGYLLEAKIPLKAAVNVDGKLPFDIRFTDATGSKLSWNDTTNSQDSDLTKIGTLTLNNGVTEAIKGTPKIDGVKDTIWDKANAISSDRYIGATSGAIAVTRTMWDADKLYIYTEVKDPSLHKEAAKGNEYQQDSIEIFLDQKNDKTESYGLDDGQYRINFDNEISYGGNPGKSAVTSAAIVVPDGYIIEAAIDLDKIKATEGDILGFDIQVNNSDNSNGTRDSIAIWNDLSGNGWSSLKKIGAVILTAAPKDDTGSGSNSGSGLPQVNNTVEAGVDLSVNGKTGTFATATSKQVDGKKVTTVVVDDSKVKDILKSDNSTITIAVNNKSNVVEGQLTGETIKNMEAKDSVLEIKTEKVTYTLPASQINIEQVSTQIGTNVEFKDIKVNIKVADAPDKVVAEMESTARKNNYQIVVTPVQFDITCTSAGKTVDVSKFNGYVERTVAIPDGVDAGRITTGVVLNSDGSFSHVPTVITTINGKNYAKINSLTNSTYSVIANNVSFMDVEKHWSKTAVNDIASRLIMDGTGKDTFAPNLAITRGEFIEAVVKALGLYRTGINTTAFGDIEKDSEYYNAVGKAYEYGIVAGYSDNTFRPLNKITRQEALTILAKAMKIAGVKVDYTAGEADTILAGFKDSGKISNWAKVSVAACANAQIVSGTTAKMLAPSSNITRAEVASVIKKLLEKSKLI